MRVKIDVSSQINQSDAAFLPRDLFPPVNYKCEYFRYDFERNIKHDIWEKTRNKRCAATQPCVKNPLKHQPILSSDYIYIFPFYAGTENRVRRNGR